MRNIYPLDKWRYWKHKLIRRSFESMKWRFSFIYHEVNLLFDRLFVEIFSLQNFVEEKRVIITDYYIKNYRYIDNFLSLFTITSFDRFCQQQAFNFEKIATFLSIIHDILQRDINLTTSETSAIKSYQRFEEILLRHSVDRPPRR